MSFYKWNSLNIKVPEKLLTDEGKLKNTLTKTNMISKYNKIPSINMNITKRNKAYISNDGSLINLKDIEIPKQIKPKKNKLLNFNKPVKVKLTEEEILLEIQKLELELEKIFKSKAYKNKTPEANNKINNLALRLSDLYKSMT